VNQTRGATKGRAGRSLLVLLALVVAYALAATTAQAASGDNLRQITSANPSSCSVQTGIAFDGQDLIWTCSGNNKLDYVSPADGTLIKTLTIAGVGGLGAAAYDGVRGKIWACNNSSEVVLIDPSNSTSQHMFNTSGCFDGLAYDGSDDTIWASPDANPNVTHYKTDGTAIQTFNVNDGGKNLLGGAGNSGVAVGGPTLYLANNGSSQIYIVPKDFSSSALFATFPRRLEDMECDNITFPGKTAIWSQDAYDRELNAYEIPNGSCGFGGLAAGAPVSGTVYEDGNSNGSFDSGEAGVAGATLLADLNGDGHVDANEPQTNSGADGAYSFSNIAPGDVKIIETPPVGYGCSAPADCTRSVTVSANSAVTGQDFGNVRSRQVVAGPCVDGRRFEYELHHGPRSTVVNVKVYVGKKRVKTVKGKNIKTVSINRLPTSGTYKVRIVSTHSNGSQLVSTRVYRECTHSAPKTRAHHHRHHGRKRGHK
jgi:hypothetical protein